MNIKLEAWFSRYGTRVAFCLIAGIIVELILLALIP